MADRHRLFALLLIICMVTVFPFLGQSYFNTKGEPREAIVSYAMLEDGNWILPESSGGDIAYKPPFFHWSIATISSLTGKVTEYTSRIPSALAMVAMILVGFCFYAKRRGVQLALLMAFITLTNFEVHRAGSNCRVDMVLSAFIVLALYQLYRWYEKGLRGFPFLAILFMSCATLTKGPVGIILPCLVTGLFLLIKRVRFFKAFWPLVGVAIVACILPALWYVAAYNQGGDNFLALVMEENFGRFAGSMSYESHEHSALYNVTTVLTGYAPYTLLVLFSLFGLKYTKLSGKPKEWWLRFVTYIRQMDPVRLYSLLSIVLIFVFYCIPKSKRSVYLLPIYPFIAYFLAEYIFFLWRKRSKAIKAYGWFLAVLGVLLPLLFVVVKCGWVPETLFKGKNAADNIAFLNVLRTYPMDAIRLLLVALPLLSAIYFFVVSRRKEWRMTLIYSILAVTFSLYLSLDGVYQPAILNQKSSRSLALEVGKRVPEGPIYSYLSVGMLRFYQINFYTNDRVKLFEKEAPAEGCVLVGEEDATLLLSKYASQYSFDEVYRSDKREGDIRDILLLYHFKKK